jgi:hypothetical protein
VLDVLMLLLQLLQLLLLLLKPLLLLLLLLLFAVRCSFFAFSSCSFSTSCPFLVFSSCSSSLPVDSSPLEGQKRTTQKLAPAQALASPDGGWSRRNPLWAPLNQKNGVSY